MAERAIVWYRRGVALPSTTASAPDTTAREGRSAFPAPPRRRWRGLRALVLFALVGAAGAIAFDRATRIAPPDVSPPPDEPLRFDDGVARVGPASLERRGALWVMHLAGDPLQLGYRHARLTAPIMAAGDLRMLDLFATFVPSAVLRSVLSAAVRARYRDVDRGFPPERRVEIYGESVAYGDRGPAFLTPYHRLVYLHALYDIALTFERSPLLGCTAFVATGEATRGGATPGHTIVGRNFDLDVDPWFDVEKTVQIVEPEGRLAFVSIAWPGLTGVVTGMNAAGIWVSVNGARAGAFDEYGVPVVFTTRTILEEAHTLDEAIAIASHDSPMASHMLLLADGARGESAVVERAPGLTPAVRRGAPVTVVANHYGTPQFAADPKNTFVSEHTSTLARESRMRQLVARADGRIDPRTAVAILRDRSGVDDVPLPLGNRNAIDALIATHSVVADLTARVVWVSEGPHALGAYRRIDLGARLAGPVIANGGAKLDERHDMPTVMAAATGNAPVATAAEGDAPLAAATQNAPDDNPALETRDTGPRTVDAASDTGVADVGDDRADDTHGDVAEYEVRGDIPPDPLLALGALDRQLLGARLRRVAERERAIGRMDAAIEEFERALALRSDDHLAWRGLAETRAAMGDGEGARAAWQRVVELTPESPAAEAEARRGVRSQ